MNLPNKISLVRIFLIPFFIAAYMLRGISVSFVYVSAGLFALASLTDMLDGMIARKYNLVTDLGKFLDTIADKLLVSSALCLIIGYNLLGLYPATMICGIIFVIVIIGRDFIISLLRTLGAAKNIIIAADMFGKVKQVAALAAIIVILAAEPLDALMGGGNPLFWTGFALLSITVLLTILSAINYTYKNRAVLK